MLTKIFIVEDIAETLKEKLSSTSESSNETENLFPDNYPFILPPNWKLTFVIVWNMIDWGHENDQIIAL